MQGSYLSKSTKSKFESNKAPMEKSKGKDKKPWKNEQKSQQKRNWNMGE